MKTRLVTILAMTLATAAYGQAGGGKHAPAAAKKLAIPQGAVLRNSLKLVADVYKDDLAKAATPEKKDAIAKAMLATAAAEKDPSGRYALLTSAADLAAAAGDLELATSAIGHLDALFEIDALKLRSDAAATAARAVHTPDQCAQFVPLTDEIIEAAVCGDRFDLADQSSEAALTAARLAGDPGLQKQAAQHIQEVHEAEAAHAGIRGALAVLQTDPADPDANLTVGKYRCFINADWNAGLPMLSRGGDETLKALAKLDHGRAKNADQQVQLADGWWEQADKANGFAQRHLRRRAGKWYKDALPRLAGLSKMRVEKRLEALHAAAPAAHVQVQKTIDLLAVVDPAKDAVAGPWQLKDKILSSDNANASRIQFPYHPPAEYDFHVEFMRQQGDDSVNLVLAAGGKHFMWTVGGWKNTVVGFDEINHVRANKNPKSISVKTVIENGKKYDAVVKVRKDGVEAYVNGKKVSQWKTNYGDMGIPDNWNLRDGAALGLATNKSPTAFYKVEVVEISGPGKIMRK